MAARNIIAANTAHKQLVGCANHDEIHRGNRTRCHTRASTHPLKLRTRDSHAAPSAHDNACAGIPMSMRYGHECILDSVQTSGRVLDPPPPLTGYKISFSQDLISRDLILWGQRGRGESKVAPPPPPVCTESKIHVTDKTSLQNMQNRCP